MPEFNETGEAFLGNNMKRGIVIVLSLCAIVAAAYFSGSKWLIRHETMTFLISLAIGQSPLILRCAGTRKCRRSLA